MKLSKQQIVLGAVLGLGLGALAVDKLFLGASAPSSAGAATAPQPTAPGLADSAQPVAAPQPGVAAAPAAPRAAAPAAIVSLSDRFSTLASRVSGAGTSADPFQAPDTWKPRVTPTETPHQAPVVSSIEPTPSFKLSLVMRPIDPSAGRTIAVINGKPYARGAVIDGFVLAEITAESATLRQGDRTVELSIPRLSEPADRSGR